MDGEIIKSADPKTFEIINDDYYYSRDDDNVYFRWKLIKNATPSSFEILSNDSIFSVYSKDKNNVYFKNNLIKWSNPETFEILDKYQEISMDKNNCYIRTEITDMLKCEKEIKKDTAEIKNKNNFSYQETFKYIEENITPLMKDYSTIEPKNWNWYTYDDFKFTSPNDVYVYFEDWHNWFTALLECWKSEKLSCEVKAILDYEWNLIKWEDTQKWKAIIYDRALELDKQK